LLIAIRRRTRMHAIPVITLNPSTTPAATKRAPGSTAQTSFSGARVAIKTRASLTSSQRRVSTLTTRATAMPVNGKKPSARATRSSSRGASRRGGLSSTTRTRSTKSDDASTRYGLENAERGDTLRWLPTALTICRVIAVPALAAVYYSEMANAAVVTGVIFIGAAITDWLDGFLARKLKASSAFGAFLDPVADKLMVAASLCLLCTRAPVGVASWAVSLPSIVIIGREITMSALREWCAAKGGEAHAAVKVNNLGKYKTATQMVALSLLLLVRDGSNFFMNGAHNQAIVDGGVYCLWLSAFLAIASLWNYMSGVIGLMLKD